MWSSMHEPFLPLAWLISFIDDLQLRDTACDKYRLFLSKACTAVTTTKRVNLYGYVQSSLRKRFSSILNSRRSVAEAVKMGI